MRFVLGVFSSSTNLILPRTGMLIDSGMAQRSEGPKDLRVPPGNRLKALKGDRKGQHSMRINDQWRICFVWKDGHAYEVEIVDYH